MQELGERFMTTLDSGKEDSKGRRIGFTVTLVDNGTDFFAHVQSARLISGTPLTGEWGDFGVPQRSKRFGSAAEATRHAYRTARERIAKLKS